MPGVYDIHVKDHFTADHALKGFDGNSSESHEHKWAIEACIRCSTLNQLGFGMDFKDAKSVLREILNRLDYTNLNDVAEFGSINPTAENLAKLIYTELSRQLNTERVRVLRVRVLEGPDCGVTYREV